MPRTRNPISDSSTFFRSPIRGPLETIGLAVPPDPIFAGLVADYDASDADAFDVTGDGQTIGTWFDASPNGHDGTAVGTGHTLQLDEQNGLPGVDMNGSDDYFDIGDNSAFENDDFSWFAVINRDVTGVKHSIGSLQAQIGGAGGIAGVILCVDPDILRGLFSNGAAFDGPVSVATISATPEIIGFVKNGTATELFQGKTSIATDTGAAAIDFTTSTTKKTALGVDWNDPGVPAPTRFFNGLFHQIKIYDRDIGTANRNALFSAWETKWGISV